MTAAHVMTVAEMQGRELLRRRVALGLLIALPLVFYLTSTGDSDKTWTLSAGGIGMAWSMAGAAFFSVLASRCTDPRLVLTGYRPVELLLGRMVLLAALALAIVAGFGVLIGVITQPQLPLLLPGLALAALIGIALGLACAALLPRELEGMLAIIGIIGISLTIKSTDPAAPYIPFYGPAKLLYAAEGRGYSALPAIAHGIAYAAILLALAVVIWTRRVRGFGPPRSSRP